VEFAAFLTQTLMERKDLMKRRTIVLKVHIASYAAGNGLVYTDRKGCE